MNAAHLLLVALVLILARDATAASSGSQTCPAMVRSQSEAIAKADWIVEANVVDMFDFKGYWGKMLSLEKIKVLKKAWDLRQVHTLVPAIGPCFAEGNGIAAGGTPEKFIGKRMRIYGSRHWDGEQRRAFYIEDASARFAGLPEAVTPSTQTRLHRNAATNSLSNGWHRARSTDGRFSVEVPAPFIDATATLGGVRVAVIRTMDPKGISFVATREGNIAEPELARTFDKEYGAFPTRRVQFKGVPALADRVARGDMILHSLMFRVPGGTFALGVTYPKEKEKVMEKDALAMKERFYHSIVFE